MAMITTEQKKKILAAMAQDRVRFDSDSKHAKVLGLATSVYSMVKQGQTDRTISDGNWIRLARRLGVSLRHEIEWKTGKTDTFIIVTKQLETAQSSALSMILCDEPNIGKTYTAKYYVQSHKNAAYIDCSQVKTKRAA